MFVNQNGNVEEMSWDLRQTYARLLTEILFKISDARMDLNFIQWFSMLKHLFIEIHQKLNKKEIEHYKQVLKDTKSMIKECESEYLGQSKEPKNIEMLFEQLSTLEKLLKTYMEEHNLFGSKRTIQGL